MSRADEAAMAAIAESVSTGRTISAAAKSAGVSAVKAQALWQRICARLGEQAA